jgi:hypothetical protein
MRIMTNLRLIFGFCICCCAVLFHEASSFSATNVPQSRRGIEILSSSSSSSSSSFPINDAAAPDDEHLLFHPKIATTIATSSNQLSSDIRSTNLRLPISDTINNLNRQRALVTGCISTVSASLLLLLTPLITLAATTEPPPPTELVIEELPPVYVPILFAIGVIGGVGVLTFSLGNVMDEEASLGLQSGARAKKERDRTRSSYFKK